MTNSKRRQSPARSGLEPAPEARSRAVAPVLDAGTEGPSPVEAGANAPAAETAAEMAPAEGEPAAAERHGALTANGFPRGGRGRPRLTPNLHPEVEQYLERIGNAARREITISDFCLVSGFRDDTVFGAWRRGDEKRCNSGQAQRFQNTLNLSPEDFLRRLEGEVTRR